MRDRDDGASLPPAGGDDEDLVGPRRGGRLPPRDDEAPDDLVGPRRGGAGHRAEAEPSEGGARIQAPRLRRKGREAREGIHRETLLTLVRDIPNFIKLLARLLRDPRVSRLDRALVGVVLAYFVMPVDLVPDLAFPVVGHLDDIYFLALALSRLVNNAGIEVLLDHWEGEERSLELLLSGLDRAGAILPAPLRGLLGERR